MLALLSYYLVTEQKLVSREAGLRVAGTLLLPVEVYQESDMFVHKLFSPLVFIIM